VCLFCNQINEKKLLAVCGYEVIRVGKGSQVIRVGKGSQVNKIMKTALIR